MMLAGIPVPPTAIADLARNLRTTGAHQLADRLERANADDVEILALTIDERAIILNALDDPPEALAEFRGVLMNEHQWREAQGSRGQKPSRLTTVMSRLVVRKSSRGTRNFGPPIGCASP
jgi:hypothetical protein